MAKSKMTIDKLAEMSQTEFLALHKKIDNVGEISKAILKVVENIEGRVGDVHSLRYVDIPELRSRIDILEEDVEKIKEKVKI